MAERKSDYYSLVNYIGTKRGRADALDIGYEMFPHKYEETNLVEDPDTLYYDRRNTLKDWSPDAPLFAYEEPRRRTYARDKLNLLDGGARVTTDPYHNEDYDTQFHDNDPRGWSLEQPWQEYRRLQETQYRTIDFKDDGDYSATSGGVHPNTLYRGIRSAQNWVKARMKIFSESFEGRSNGGVGVYANTSDVFKSDYEDSSVAADDTRLSQSMEDPIIRRRVTSRLSDIVNSGSAFLHSNSTTDHRVKTASYGKLYTNQGFIPHESQLRILEDDTNWSRMEGLKSIPKNVVKMMANQINGNMVTETAAMSARLNLQTPGDKARFPSQTEQMQVNKKNMVIKDVMALLGITQNELKYIGQLRNSNSKQADQMLANLYDMAEMLHKLPTQELTKVRDDLLLKASGQGLHPVSGDNVRNNQNQVILNPKIINFMEETVRKGILPGDPMENREGVAQEKRIQQMLTETSIYVPKSILMDNLDNLQNIYKSEKSNFFKKPYDEVYSYKKLAKYALDELKNRVNTIPEQEFTLSKLTPNFIQGNISNLKSEVNLRHGQTDNDFYGSKTLERHIAPLGKKYTMRNHESDLPLNVMNERN